MGAWGASMGPQKFKQYFRCYPVAMMPGKSREELNYGGKIVMPPSALNKLTMLHITYPMMFELHSEETSSVTYAGVLEFIAEEGRVYLPQWIMDTLGVGPGSLLQVGSVDLPLGSFVKIEPQSVDFLDISDPKAVLENALRNFTTLTVGDIFQISYNDKVFSIKVLEAKPQSEHNSICVVETDLEVDFAPPVGYVEPSATGTPSSSSVPSRAICTPVGTMANSIGYNKLAHQDMLDERRKKDPFSGSGNKLSGKTVNEGAGSSENGTNGVDGANAANAADRDTLPSTSAPPLDLPFGQLFFGYPIVPLKHQDEEKEREANENTSANVHFKGAGQSLRQSKKRKDENKNLTDSRRPRTTSNSPEVIEID